MSSFLFSLPQGDIRKDSKGGTFSSLTSLKVAISISLTLGGFASVISNEEII